MRKQRLGAAVGISLVLGLPCLGAGATGLPTRVGQCVETRIDKIGERLTDSKTGQFIPGTGSALSFTNQGDQESYEEVPAIERSRRGDRVLMCLVKLPENCPKGDDRGRVYTTTNLRTMESWTLPDSEHMCGGA